MFTYRVESTQYLDPQTPKGSVPQHIWETVLAWDTEILVVEEWSASYGGELLSEDYMVLIPETTSGDYTGCLVQAANRKYLQDYYPEEWFYTRTYSHSTESLYLVLEGDITVGDDYADLIDTLGGLTNYPLLCDETHSELETAIVDEAINGVLAELDDILPPSVAEGYGDDLAGAVYELMYDGSDYPYVEGIEDAMLPFDAEGMAEALADHLPAWKFQRSIHPDQLTLA